MPQTEKNEWNKCKNHFNEMKGDVGMSLHEKEGNNRGGSRIDGRGVLSVATHSYCVILRTYNNAHAHLDIARGLPAIAYLHAQAGLFPT